MHAEAQVDKWESSFSITTIPPDVIDERRDHIVLDEDLTGVDLIGGDVLEGVVQRHSQCENQQNL